MHGDFGITMFLRGILDFMGDEPVLPSHSGMKTALVVCRVHQFSKALPTLAAPISA
jgi:hypothetical protein